MTKRKIKDLPSLSSADDFDLIPIVDIDEPVLENQTKKITVANLLDGLGGATVEGRIRLEQDTTFYVDKDNGSNFNNGLSLATAFQTIKFALGHIGSLDLNNFKVTLEIQPGDYVNEGLLHLPLLVGASSITCDFGPPLGPPSGFFIETHLDIGPLGFKDPQYQGGIPLYLPPIEVDHFGYYSINFAIIRFGVEELGKGGIFI